jgi:hypothetical protein
MKPFYQFLLTAAVVCSSLAARACDVCGGGMGSGAPGFLPLQQRHFIGLRWQMQDFKTLAHPNGSGTGEAFRTLDLWGRCQLGRRWQLIAVAPVQFIRQRGAEVAPFRSSGLGDASLQVQYTLLDPARQEGLTWRHALLIGAGVKLPTGASRRLDSAGELLHANLQPGSGSTDGLLSATYILRRNAWGFYADASARLTTANAAGYRQGNRLNAGLRAFWWKPWGRLTLVPHAGLLLDAADLDAERGSYQAESGGYALYGSIGAEVYAGDAALGLTWQRPMAHELAAGYVQPGGRLAVTGTWMFGGKMRL